MQEGGGARGFERMLMWSRVRSRGRNRSVSVLALAFAAVAVAAPAAAAAPKAPPVTTSTTLSESASNAAYGEEQTEVFSAAVHASNGTVPAGQATVLAGTKKVCVVKLVKGAGTCSPKSKALANGSYTLVALYKKSSKYAESRSGAVGFAVGAPPTVAITSAPSGNVPSGSVEISFTSGEPWASFECILDGAPYSRCSSPDRLDVGPGSHEFEVRAVSAAGIRSTKAAAAGWVSVGQAPVLELCGERNHNETLSSEDAAVYVLTCEVTVAPKVTLTIEPGTIVKAESGVSVDDQGSLVAEGSAERPITFTSWRDDSVGGDTNGDGNSTVPAAGDWGGIYTSSREGDPSPTLDLEHVNVDYVSNAVRGFQARTSVLDDSVAHATGIGIEVNSSEGVPVLDGNSVEYASGDAIDIDNSSIDMADLNGNSGSHDGLDGVGLGDDTVTVSSALPWSGTLVPVLTFGCSSLTVPAKVTLTLGAGTILKGESCAGIDVQGSLVANGTASDPVTLTSWRDDSVGGDTNDDGDATLPAPGDWGGVYTSQPGGGNAGPTLDLEHVNVDYASYAVDGNEARTLIVDSSVAHSSGAGIVVGYPEGIPVVTGNNVEYAASDAIDVIGASIDMADLTGNSGENDGLNGVALNDDTVTVSSALPWSGTLVPVLTAGCESLTVPAKVTLTLGAGTVLKGENCTYIDVQGSLVANGTASDPVTLTSWRDDSVGGDTNDDGNATVPAEGDWGGVYTSQPGGGNANPTLDLEHVDVDYAGNAVNSYEARTSIVDSSVAHSSGAGITVNYPEGLPTVEGNDVTYAGGEAIEVAGASIDMADLNGNSGSNDALNGVALGSDTVTVSSALPWSGTLVPVLTAGCDSLTVPAKVTLTLGAGTVVKGENCTYINVEGALEAKGTATDSVTLTSWRDDSVGGDTNDDGDATLPGAGDWSGVYTREPGDGNANPTLALEHVNVDYASNAVRASHASTSILDSSVAHASSGGIDVEEPEGIPTVEGNDVTYVGADAIDVNDASIDMADLNGNSGGHDALNGVGLGDDTVTVSSALPWSGTLVPVLTDGCDSLTVPAKVTLTLGAGTVVKGESCTYIIVDGTLVGSGTAEDPVTLTSWRDNSVGGETDDGEGSVTPAAGDWGGINAESGATVSLIGTTIEYATTGLSVAEGDEATIHGAVLHSTVGLEANTWVDASGVNWGSPTGPAPGGQGTPVEGDGPMVVPWEGWVAPAKPVVEPEPQEPPPAQCAAALFVGLRGSGESPRGSEPYEPGESTNMGSRVPGAFFAFREEFEKLHPGATVRGYGLHYPALPVPSFWGVIFDGAFGEYEDSYWEGALDVAEIVREEASACPQEKIVLGGYSQGALSIHLALTDLMSGGELSHVAGVILIADPENRGDDTNVTKTGSAAPSADGLYTKVFGDGDTAVIPSALRGKAIEICHKGDIVCAPGIGAGTAEHEDYAWSEIEPLGTWMAERVPG
jgi:hypothetical protein